MDMACLMTFHQQLRASGRLQEILDADGNIRPSEKSISQIYRRTPEQSTNQEMAERYRLAQALTLMDLAEKYSLI